MSPTESTEGTEAHTRCLCFTSGTRTLGTAGSKGVAPTRNISVGCDDGAFRLPEEYEVEDVVKIRAIRGLNNSLFCVACIAVLVTHIFLTTNLH